jgi:hypothetical protein
MNSLKKLRIFFVIFFTLLCICFFSWKENVYFPARPAYAEKEPYYTSDDEFLPLGTIIEEEEDEKEKAFLADDTLIKNGIIKFDIENKELMFEIIPANFPPRIIMHLYGVKSEEKIYHFLKNLDILGVVYNPFQHHLYAEYVIFFKDWIQVKGEYVQDEKRLYIEFEMVESEYQKGYGVRIADTKIDPLPQVIEIKNQLGNYGLESFLLIASDRETIVLESPFYGEKAQAIEYFESLENIGFAGKLTIRDYLAFPQPNRFDVVSEVVITGESGVNLKNIVQNEFTPQKVYQLSYSDLYLLTKEIFTPSVQEDEEVIARYYFDLSEIYRNFETEDESELEMAVLVSVKILEVIVFQYPQTQTADDALWEMANWIREYGIMDVLSEEECYKKIIAEYPESIFNDEAKERIEEIKNLGVTLG